MPENEKRSEQQKTGTAHPRREQGPEKPGMRQGGGDKGKRSRPRKKTG